MSSGEAMTNVANGTSAGTLNSVVCGSWDISVVAVD